MITCQNDLFHLKNSCFSYLMQVDAYGQLQHIHFGQPVQDVDAQALSCRPGLGWGSSVRLEDSDIFYSISAVQSPEAVILNVGDTVVLVFDSGDGSILSAVTLTIQ